MCLQARRIMRLWMMVALVVLVPMTVAASNTNLIQNPSFEAGLDSADIPLNWRVFSGTPVTQIRLSTEHATQGAHSLKLIDESSSGSVGLMSDRVPAKAATLYRVETDVLVESGNSMVYLDFLDGNYRRIEAKTATINAGTAWGETVIESMAPAGTEYIQVILYMNIPATGTVYFDNVRLYDVSDREIVIDTREAKGAVIGFRPLEGAHVEVNPPPFIWLPEPLATAYVVEYSQDPAFAPAATYRTENVKLPLYISSRVLEPGVWYWRYWAETSAGKLIGPSQVRSFVIEEGLVELPLPPTEEWMARIPDTHPRLFVRSDKLDEQLAHINKALVEIPFAQARTEMLLGIKPPAEPPTAYPGGALDIDVWRANLNATEPAMIRMQEFAFLYLVTGKKEYAEAGKQLLLNFARWNPAGSTAYRQGNPEISMRLLYYIPRAYTWLYDALTEEERDIVRYSAQIRGREAHSMIKGLPFETNPYSSHPGRMLGFLGQLSIAFLDEIPEARDWLEYVVQLAFAVYPAWGGEAGGYSEGLGYWSAYMSWVFDFFDALKVAADLDLYQKPFFRNTGYFALYAGYPGVGTPFSDGQNSLVGSGQGNVMTQLARVHQNGYFRWYVDRVGGGDRSTIFSLLFKHQTPAAVEPADLPDARWFSDVGWVSLHRDLTALGDNMVFTFKSSPMGTASHSHADQNAFVLYAYGDGVAISTGLYPWSRSPHHDQWTNQTLSKNSILIDGRGQSTFDFDAKGEILGLFHSSGYDYTAGEAVVSYKNPNLTRYSRHVFYIRPDLYLLVDDLRAKNPVKIDWLYHSSFAIDWDADEQIAHTAGRKAEMDLLLLTPQGFNASISDKYVPPPEVTSWTDTWHMTATLPEKRSEEVIVALLAPRKVGSDGPFIVDKQVTEVGDDVWKIEFTHRTGDVLTREEVWIELPGTAEASRLAAVQASAYDAAGQRIRAFAVGNAVSGDMPQLVTVPEGLGAAITWSAAEKEIAVETGNPALGRFGTTLPGRSIRIETTFAPAQVVLNGIVLAADAWTYDAASGTVTVTM
ncbi:MAG TPA: DUF4962 domain-containing protein [Firmicutes bacterium]|jgi:hypothetical protein|nr:DUF4962 domain-containing protein [Bacillota bacterium]